MRGKIMRGISGEFDIKETLERQHDRKDMCARGTSQLSAEVPLPNCLPVSASTFPFHGSLAVSAALKAERRSRLRYLVILLSQGSRVRIATGDATIELRRRTIMVRQTARGRPLLCDPWTVTSLTESRTWLFVE
jgi:hypothetical protein